MKIANAELKVIRFGADDVIATSIFFLNTGSGYDMVYGEMTDYDSTAEGWHINDWSKITSSAEERQGYINDKAYYAYDAYDYDVPGRSGYYTKGASYYDLYGNQ